jgi:hypothetical protein
MQLGVIFLFFFFACVSLCVGQFSFRSFAGVCIVEEKKKKKYKRYSPFYLSLLPFLSFSPSVPLSLSFLAFSTFFPI